MSKFDKEKSDYYDENKQLQKDLKKSHQVIAEKDSAINGLQVRIKSLEKEPNE